MISQYLALGVRILFIFLTTAIIIRVVLSWFQVDRHNALFAVIHDIADPILDVFKRVIPPIGMFDISPMVALFALNFLEWLLLSLINLMNF